MVLNVANNTLTFGGNFTSGNSTIIKTGQGKLVLGGSGVSQFVGNVNQGELVLAHDSGSAIGSGGGSGGYGILVQSNAVVKLAGTLQNQIPNGLGGVSYIQTRQPAKSREVFAKLFKVQTNSAAAFMLNAKMHVRQQFEETAEIELKKALEIDPKLPEVRFILGELAIYRAEIDKGIEYLKQEIGLNPSNAMAYYRLGEGLSRQLKWDEAIPPLQKSIWLNPFFSGPYIVLGKVYLKKQDLGNAENLLRRSTAIDPNNFGAHYLLAQVLQQSGKSEEAKSEFALAEKLRGNGEKEP